MRTAAIYHDDSYEADATVRTRAWFIYEDDEVAAIALAPIEWSISDVEDFAVITHGFSRASITVEQVQ